MIKTGTQIQGDIYRLLKESTLEGMLTGGIYRSGYRPRSSRLEDAVVIFTAGQPDQLQTGVVTVNVYVPDIDPYKNGVLVMDGARVETLEKALQEWVESLTCSVSNYKLQLKQTICTEADEDINQHFIVVKLKYTYFDGE